ncbi:MAG: hypothetical protein ACTTKL_07070 [Treponema sp.]
MKRAILTGLSAALILSLFGCAADVSGGNGVKDLGTSGSAGKITLAASDVEAVKGYPLAGGKFTVGKSVTSISGSDIQFKSEKLSGHTPELTFGTGTLTDWQLRLGENSVTVNVKEDGNFKASSFSLTVIKSADAVSPPSSGMITLSVSDIETILTKHAESDGKTFKIGNAAEISVSDIVFKSNSLKGKTPALVLWYLDKFDIKHSSHKNKLRLVSVPNPFNLTIEVSGDGFTPVKLTVTLSKVDGASSPSVTPSGFDGTLKAEHIATIFGQSAQSDGSFKISSDKTQMERKDVVFKPGILSGNTPSYELYIDTGSGWEFTTSGSGPFAKNSIKLPTKQDDRNRANFKIKVKKDSHFKAAEIPVKLTWD